MYRLFESLSLAEFLLQQLPILGTSILIVNYFFKLGSFALECVVFLIFWFVLDKLTSLLFQSIKGNKNAP